MNQQDFDNVVAETIQGIQKLLTVKGGEYAGSTDRLANFKRGAELTGCTPLQCLFVYMSKHYDAVATYVKDSAAGVERERSEPISGRLDDLINYCILAKALVEESNLADTVNEAVEERKDFIVHKSLALRVSAEEHKYLTNLGANRLKVHEILYDFGYLTQDCIGGYSLTEKGKEALVK